MTREEAIRCLRVHSSTNGSGLCTDKQHYEAKQMAIEVLEQSPLLDKVRAEINGMYRVILKGTPKDDWAVRWNDCLDDVLQIIDKYREESEEIKDE